MSNLPMLEMSCPEYFFSDIGKVEDAGGGVVVRFFLCVRRGQALEPVAAVVCPEPLREELAKLLLTTEPTKVAQFYTGSQRPQ